MKVYFFGDIEGEQSIINATTDILNQIKFSDIAVFLGDIFQIDENLNTSIEVLEHILSRFTNIEHYITSETSMQTIAEMFKLLGKIKHINNYNNDYPCFLVDKLVEDDMFIDISKTDDFISYITSKNNILINSPLHIEYEPKEIPLLDTSDILPINTFSKQNYSNTYFLFGNKEVAFIKILMNMNLEKSYLENNTFHITSTYKTKRFTEPYSISLTIKNLNLAYNYLIRCYSFIIINDIICMHCYMNYKRFTKTIRNYNYDYKFNNIISGHNKGIGKFFESDIDTYKNISINMIDYTKYEDKPDLDINNTIITYHNKTIILPNHKRFTQEFTLYNTIQEASNNTKKDLIMKSLKKQKPRNENKA